jgi:SrtB family sortase
MKRKKRRSRTKADIITGVLYGILGLLVLAAMYGIGRGAYALLGATVGNFYYASLAEKAAADTVDFVLLKQDNPEVRGWVRLADTAIDLPLVKTTDNDFYLNHRFDEKRNKLGTPFIDSGNVGDFSDRHTVIYGHALSSGAMFGSLWEYENPNYFMRHPEIQLFLPDGTQRTLAVFACSRVDGVRSAIPIAFFSEGAFLSFIDELLTSSAFSSNVKIAATDRIVSFCVALPNGAEGRLLVSCKITQSSGMTTIGDPAALAPAETAQMPDETLQPLVETALPQESPQG